MNLWIMMNGELGNLKNWPNGLFFNWVWVVDREIRHCKDIITFLIKYENNLNGALRNQSSTHTTPFFNRPFSLTLFNQGKIYHFFLLKVKGKGKGAYVRK